MLIYEILCETPSDDVDLQNIARYISSYIRYMQLHGKYKFKFKLGAIFKKTQKSPNVNNQLIKEKLSNVQIVVRTDTRESNFGFFAPNDFSIILYMFKMSTEYQLQTTLVHELQHAWDYVRSNGIDWTDTVSNSYEYTKSSEEINARFAQVLMDLSNMNVTSKNMITYIKAVFKHHSLFKELFDDYPDGQKKYNQLLKRAYKFCKEINNYEKFNHNELPRQTIKQMIKNIISKI